MTWRVVSNEKSSPDICREKGFKVGDRIVGDEGYGPTVIELTAIGESSVLAKRISHKGVLDESPHEGSWTLAHRDWQKV